jgi:protein gp37
MSDLFHEDVPDDYIVAAFEVMAAVDWHVYQVLTKRPERMRRMIADRLQFVSKLEHIWWGTTVENRKQGVPRIETLRKTDVAKRFLSCEPLLEHLGKVNLDGIG